MAVDQEGVVDFVSRLPNGDCNLTISDHLEWSAEGDHLIVLQAKMNRYLAFIESGELLERFPEFQEHQIVIKLFCLHAPDEQGVRFLELAGNAIQAAGFRFEYQVGLSEKSCDQASR